MACEIYIYPEDSIQEAIDGALPGATIIVKPGTYEENIRIEKSLIVRSESGDPEDTIIVARNSGDHVFFINADDVTISGFEVRGAGDGFAGIYLLNCKNCRISNNKIKDNGYGIYLNSSSDNLLFNNYLKNNINAGFEGSNTGNHWNTAKSEGENIVGGSFLGGNFWASPDGTGFSQTTEDGDGDGICDESLELAAGNTDNLPLAIVSEVPGPKEPVANFSTNVTEGSAPLTVRFEDLSSGALSSWLWDFGDGNQSDEQEPIHTYRSPGNYTVNLTVSDGSLSDSKEIADFIIVEASGGAGDTEDIEDTGDTGDAGDTEDTGDTGDTGDSEDSVSSSSSRHKGTGSARIIHREVLESEGDSYITDSKSPAGDTGKSDGYEALQVQENTAKFVEASGSEKEEGRSIPRFLPPIGLIGVASAAYLLRRSKKSE